MNQMPQDPMDDLLEPDPELDSQLSTLQQFSPIVGFEDRVMARVSIPQPAALEPRRAPGRFQRLVRRPAWALAGSLATGSSLATALVLRWITNSGFGRTQVWAWLNQVQGPVNTWVESAMSQATAYASQQTAAAWTKLGLWAVGAGAGMWILPAACAWGLYRVMEQHGMKGTTAYARR